MSFLCNERQLEDGEIVKLLEEYKKKSDIVEIKIVLIHFIIQKTGKIQKKKKSSKLRYNTFIPKGESISLSGEVILIEKLLLVKLRFHYTTCEKSTSKGVSSFFRLCKTYERHDYNNHLLI